MKLNTNNLFKYYSSHKIRDNKYFIIHISKYNKIFTI